MTSSPENTVKPAFRKPPNDLTNRNYRRRSVGSSSSDENDKNEHGSSPSFSMEDIKKAYEHKQRKHHDGEYEEEFDYNGYVRGGDCHKHSDHHSSKNFHVSKHDDYGRREKDGYHKERHYQVSSSSARESRDSRRDDDRHAHVAYSGSRNRIRDKERESYSLEAQKFKDKNVSSPKGRKYSISSYDEKEKEKHRWDARDEESEYHRSHRDHRGDRKIIAEKSKASMNDSSDRYYDKEKKSQHEKKKHDGGREDRHDTNTLQENNVIFRDENEEFHSKKPKVLASKGEGQPCNSKISLVVTEGSVSDLGPRFEAPGTAADVDTAKVAAMKAAELVNKNLLGVSNMSTEQKKKLLWGNKNSSTTEERSHRWDTSLFGDRERQEKFNKLMGVRGRSKGSTEPAPNNQAEKQMELHMDLEKQYTAGLRRRDGRTVGLGL